MWRVGPSCGEGVVRAIMLAEGVVDIVVVRPAGGVALLAGGADRRGAAGGRA